MSKKTTGEQAYEYCRSWREVSLAYEISARAVGMSYSSMFILNIIFVNPKTCTQKYICEETLLPKQTVNAIITGFLKQGFVKLTESESDRRNKIVHLTKQGRELAQTIIPKIQKAESQAMGMLDAGQRTALLENAARYAVHFQKCMSEFFNTGTPLDAEQEGPMHKPTPAR